jgi:hypothetical protein
MSAPPPSPGRDSASLLAQTYAAFNARDIDGALAAMHPEDGLIKAMEIGQGE